MTPPEKIQHSRRLIGYAISHSPEAIVASSEASTNVGQLATDYVQHQLTGKKPSLDCPIGTANSVILTNGVNDVDTIVRQIVKNYDGQTEQDEMIELFTQPDTIDVIAKHARLPEKVLWRTLKNNLHNHPLSRTIELDSSASALQTAERYDEIAQHYGDDTENGCPLAIRNTEQRLDPLFVSFSEWAGELSVRSLYAGREQQARNLPSTTDKTS